MHMLLYVPLPEKKMGCFFQDCLYATQLVTTWPYYHVQGWVEKCMQSNRVDLAPAFMKVLILWRNKFYMKADFYFNVKI